MTMDADSSGTPAALATPPSTPVRLTQPHQPTRTPPSKPFAIRPSPTGGLGAFATRFLPPGSVLLEEAPLFTARRADIFSAFARLGRRRQRKAMKLHASDHVKPGTPWLEAVWDTNSFATGNDREAGLFPIASRFNHACTPCDNVHYAYDADRKKLRLWVAEHGDGVEESEELKVCYGRGKTPALLYRWYGFRCACGACEGVSDEEVKQFSVKW